MFEKIQRYIDSMVRIPTDDEYQDMLRMSRRGFFGATAALAAAPYFAPRFRSGTSIAAEFSGLVPSRVFRASIKTPLPAVRWRPWVPEDDFRPNPIIDGYLGTLDHEAGSKALDDIIARFS